MRIYSRDYERAVENLTHELNRLKVPNRLLALEYQRMKKRSVSKAASQAVFDSANAKKAESNVEIQILETALKIANDKLSDTKLSAPFDGIISEINIEQYEIAQANVTMVVLQSLEMMDIHVNIPEGNIPVISLSEGERYNGQTFKVTFPMRGSHEFSATFEEFKPTSAIESNTYELRLRMKQPKNFIVLPGMAADVHGLPHMIRQIENAVKIPFAAVICQDNEACGSICQIPRP